MEQGLWFRPVPRPREGRGYREDKAADQRRAGRKGRGHSDHEGCAIGAGIPAVRPPSRRCHGRRRNRRRWEQRRQTRPSRYVSVVWSLRGLGSPCESSSAISSGGLSPKSPRTRTIASADWPWRKLPFGHFASLALTEKNACLAVHAIDEEGVRSDARGCHAPLPLAARRKATNSIAIVPL